jgi:hypothetical protein
VHGYSATAAGAATLPFVLVMFLLSRWSGGLVEQIGARRPLVVGPLVVAAGYALLALPGTGGRYATTFFPAILVLGLGMALSVAPLTTTVMNAVPGRHVGIASGINNAVSRAAGLLAIAGMSVLVVHVFDREVERRLATLRLAPDVVAAVHVECVRLAGAEPPPDAAVADRIAMRQAIHEAFVAAFRRLALIAAALAIGASLTAALTIDGRAADERRAPP